MSHVFLVGFMGAGKSTVGPLLAAIVGSAFVDLDQLVSSREGLSASEIFTHSGEAAFRSAEFEALRSLASEAPSVVACGGGIVTFAGSVELMHSMGTTVLLDVTLEVALARIGTLDSGRPLLAGGPEAACELLEARRALYHAAADITVQTVGATPLEIAETIALALEGAGS